MSNAHYYYRTIFQVKCIIGCGSGHNGSGGGKVT